MEIAIQTHEVAFVLDNSALFPKDSHPPIVFPAAILRDSQNADTARVFAFLTSPKATAVFAHFGYHTVAAAH